MSSFNKQIYEQLISDNQFVEWASGKNNTRQKYWAGWKKEHPDFTVEFEEACKTVTIIEFNPPKISRAEVTYLWSKTKKNLCKPRKNSPVREIISWYGKIAGVLIIPLIILSVWLFQNNQTVKSDINNIIENNINKLITVKAPVGGRLNFELPDGSKVWLNAGTVFEYPAYFNSNSREVNLLGEAVFEIKKSNTPFIVHNPGPDIKVYGTIFSVNSYNDQENIIVALVSGKISLDVNHKEVFLSPGEVSMFNKQKRELTITRKNTEQYTCWREGRFMFRDTPLKEILATLQRQYNVTISLSNPKLANYKYNAAFEQESLDQILYMLSLSAPIKYTFNKPKRNKDGSFTKAKVTIYEDKNRIINQ
ncbi:MAG: FecR family protein [Chlorobi bacterium]|nr:FecR family protein [Chlorobiota bacterium]